MSVLINSLDLGPTAWFLIRFLMNLITLIILIRFLYYEYRNDGVPEYLFAFFLLGIIVFLICIALEMVEVQLGFALGLFALFGILRFRTESIPVREMTYLFVVIGIAMINSLVDFIDPINGILLSNALVIIPTWILEAFISKTSIRKREIIYDNIEDVLGSEKQLIEKLTGIIGHEIRKIKITRIDFVRKSATILIYYKE